MKHFIHVSLDNHWL